MSFRVFHPTLNPDQIINGLERNWKIKNKWKLGEQKRTPRGKPLNGLHNSNYIVYELLPDSNMTLSDFIDSVADSLRLKKRYLQVLIETGGKLELYVSFIASEKIGEYFDWKTLSNLAELKINFGFEIESPFFS